MARGAGLYSVGIVGDVVAFAHRENALRRCAGVVVLRAVRRGLSADVDAGIGTLRRIDCGAFGFVFFAIARHVEPNIEYSK